MGLQDTSDGVYLATAGVDQEISPRLASWMIICFVALIPVPIGNL